MVLLHKVSTGELLAVIHDGFMQKTRVGGLAGVAAKYLARKDADVLAVIGSGWQATAQVEAHCHARPSIREVRVYSPNARRREAFAAEMAGKVKAQVKAVASGAAAVRGASIVATATNSIEPVLFSSWLDPGTFITSVKEVEFEDAVYKRCDLLTCNRRGPIWARYVVGGSQTIPEQGREIWYRWTQEKWKSVRLLGRIVAGREPGRTDDQQIIAFINQGEGLQFAAVGQMLYDLACKRGLGDQCSDRIFSPRQEIHSIGQPPDQSAFAPENLTTLAHLSVSSAISFPKSAGVPPRTVPPKSASRAFILGSVRPTLICLLRLSTMSGGVFLGATTPNHVLAS